MPTTITRLAPALARIALVGACVAGTATTTGIAAGAAPPLPPGSETARFRLVVEGEITAVTDLDAAASIVCQAQVNLRLSESATYRRGRGVTVEFVRLGRSRRAPVILRRVGRTAGVTFTVDVVATRTASGFGSRTGELCPPVTEDLSQGPECGVPQASRGTASLQLARSALGLRLVGIGAILDIACPVSEVLGARPDMRFSWPTPPRLFDEPISLAQVFGTKRVIVARADSLERRETRSAGVGALFGSMTDFGRNRATIRLIRVP